MLGFFRLSHQFLRVIWHVRSVILAMFGWLMVGAVVIAYVEKMPFGDALYLSFITGLSVGFGDIVPKTLIGRFIVILIGFTGVLFTGLVVAAIVETIRRTYKHSDTST
jgi:voltage-gated potassium channel